MMANKNFHIATANLANINQAEFTFCECCKLESGEKN